jgi:ribosomal protein S18 acetylase RimI-like enzyme
VNLVAIITPHNTHAPLALRCLKAGETDACSGIGGHYFILYTSGDTMNVRMANHGDVETLVRFNLAMAKETEHKALDRATLEKGVRSVLDDERKGFYLAAEVDGRVVGSLMITFEWSDWRNGWFWWLQSVYVEPAFRGQGVFRALYGEVKRRAAKNPLVIGCRLYVEHDNRVAQDVYSRLGLSKTNYHIYEGNR